MGTLATPAKNPPIPTRTQAAVGGANCGATRCARSAKTAPVTPPMTSDGAKTPPDPPDEMVNEVARILAGSSSSRILSGSCVVEGQLQPAVAAAEHLRHRQREQRQEQATDRRLGPGRDRHRAKTPSRMP